MSSGQDIDVWSHFISDIRIKIGIRKAIIVWVRMELTEANFVEAMLDVEVRDSCPCKRQPLNGSIDVILSDCIRDWHVVLYIDGDIVESLHPGDDSGI